MPKWFCPWPSLKCYYVCLNGIVENNLGKPHNWYSYSEACDEGDITRKTIGCSDDCQTITIGWECPVANVSCNLICGNNVLNVANPLLAEQCDLGAANNDDINGCTNFCQIMQDWECPQPTVSCNLLCGNGRVDNIGSGSPGGPHSESCDDGNRVPGDGCDSLCAWELYERGREFGYIMYYIHKVDKETLYAHWHHRWKTACVNAYYKYPAMYNLYPGHNYNTSYTFEFNTVFPGAKMVCFTGVYCDQCLGPRFPGYPIEYKAPNPGEMPYQAHNSRGKLYIIEDYENMKLGFSFVYNDKTVMWLYNATNELPLNFTHNKIGSVRLAMGKYYIENSGEYGFKAYKIKVTTGVPSYVSICNAMTNTNIPPLQGSDKFIWWPIYNLLMTRQYSGRQMEIFKASKDLLEVEGADCVASMLTVKYYYSDIFGQLPVYPVFMNSTDNTYTYMYLYRKYVDNMGAVTYIVNKYDWYPETGVLYEDPVSFDITEEVLDMVAFPTRVVVTTATQVWSISQANVKTSATINTVGGVTGKKWRFFQKRPDPMDDTIAPKTYAYYLEENYRKNIFNDVNYVSGDTYLVKDVDDTNIYWLPIRYRSTYLDNAGHNYGQGYLLTNPFDLGKEFMVIYQANKCANNTATHMLDFFEYFSVGIYNLTSRQLIRCVDIDLGLSMSTIILQ